MILQCCKHSSISMKQVSFSFFLTKLPTNTNNHSPKSPHSTSLFPPSLIQAFSNPNLSNPKSLNTQNAKQTQTKKARSLAQIINDKPWSARTESHLSTHSSLSQTTFFQTLRLIKTPIKALSFFKWVKDSNFTLNSQAYFMMLEILGKAKNLNLARNFLYSIPKESNNVVHLTDKLFNSLIRSYGNAGLFQESVNVFQMMKTMGVSPSNVTFNSLFVILFKRGRTGMVFELYHEMLRTFGVKPDSCTFNVLIRGFCVNSRVDEAFRVFREMEKFECEPDVITYNTIVDGLCRAGKVSVARNVLVGMRKKGESLRPNLVTYTTLIRGYCEKRDIDKAFDVFREMVDDGFKPNEITFNTIIQGLCETEKYDMIRDMLSECKGRSASVEFVPDTCTFNTVMNAHCSRGNLEEAVKVFEKMKELNVKQDSTTYSTLMRAFCQKGNFDKAQELLDELSEKEILLCDDGCTPVTAAYNPILSYLCANGKTKKAERVFRQLMKRGVQDPPAYKTLILGHCKEETFLEGHKLLVLMLRRDFKPGINVYESLIEGLLQKGVPNMALDTLERMLRSSHLPTTSTFHRILMALVEKGSAHESASLLMLMLDKNVRSNINLSTDTIRILFRNGLQDKAFQVVRSLYENGYVVNMKELILFLCQSGKLLEAGELLAFSLKNNENVDIDVCNPVLSGLCKARRPLEAFQLYYELLEKGIQQPFSYLQDLKNALDVEGKLKEAEFVAKRILVS